MEMHRLQLGKIKHASKYEELRKKTHGLEVENRKLLAKVREMQGVDKKLEVVVDAATSEHALSKMEQMMIKGIQKVNQERGRRALHDSSNCQNLEPQIIEKPLINVAADK